LGLTLNQHLAEVSFLYTKRSSPDFSFKQTVTKQPTTKPFESWSKNMEWLEIRTFERMASASVRCKMFWLTTTPCLFWRGAGPKRQSNSSI
jgi:hypothetical protein